MISGLKHALRDVRPEFNLCFQGSKPIMVINPDGLDLLRVPMCFLWVSEGGRQQKPCAGLLVLDKQKYEADKIPSRAHQIRNL